MKYLKKAVIQLFLLSIPLTFFGQEIQMPHGDGFQHDCSQCHTTDNWQVSVDQIDFRHADTGYPLNGNHSQVHCRECHENLIFSHIGVTCLDCHSDIHKGEMGDRCEDCHSPAGWEDRSEHFLMHMGTQFPLLGAHALLDCQSCHEAEQRREYKTVPVECKGCHMDDFMSTLNPSHRKAGFDFACENCHLPNSMNWNQPIYGHSRIFPLEGGHANLECTACHSAIYEGLPVDCYSCHEQEYNVAKNPDHSEFGFPTNCEACHNTRLWEEAEFDHLSASGFPLTGAHTRIFCTDCHVNNQLTGLPQECYGCHADDYNEADNPDHASGQFSYNCLDCHSGEQWIPAEFDHNQTAFPLTGAHSDLECASCHENGQFSGIPSDCWSCHEMDYNSVEDPDHAAGNFDQNCTVCHTTSSWESENFDHNITPFTLTGAHITVECSACHSTGFSGTPTECYPCHEFAYTSTTDPDHQAAAFPINCESCHTTSVWTPSEFDHDGLYFPIYSGEHRNEWNVCSDCHVAQNDFERFECINCHERSETDSKHSEEPDYVYESQACYICHPTGEGEVGGDDR